MGLNDVKDIMAKASGNEAFRKLLATNPELALRDYQISEEEKEALCDVAKSSFSFEIDHKGQMQLWT